MGKLTPISFIRNQLTAVPEVDKTADLSGRNVVVTGSNVGLGLETARHFASMKPAKLILAVRSMEKGEKAKNDILQTHPAAHVEVWKCDMGSFESVKSFAERCKKDLDRLDIAVLNAGVSLTSWQVSSDGYEQTLQVNGIATGLLAVLLLPQIEETAKKPAPSSSSTLLPHLTLTSSEVHYWAPFPYGKAQHPIHEMNERSKFSWSTRYNDSKLLDVFMCREIAKRASSNIVVNNVNPGLCHSELTSNGGFIMSNVANLLKFLLARTTEVGARTLVWAALNKTKQGAYSSLCREEEESDYSLSPAGLEAQKKVWADLVDIWQKIDPSLGSLKA